MVAGATLYIYVGQHGGDFSTSSDEGVAGVVSFNGGGVCDIFAAQYNVMIFLWYTGVPYGDYGTAGGGGSDIRTIISPSLGICCYF